MTPADRPDNAYQVELLTAAREGDDTAFRVLYRLHAPRMRGLLHRMLNRREADTDDALQESWLRALRSASGYRGESSLSSWLCGIAIRVGWEAIRQSRPGDSLETTALVADAADPGLERVDLEDALHRIPDGWRIVVWLHDVEGYTHVDIGAMLGMPASTSRSHLFRGRSALRRLLQSYERISR